MQTWKKMIFVNAIKTRMKAREGTAEEIVASYTNLTATEKEILLLEFSK